MINRAVGKLAAQPLLVAVVFGGEGDSRMCTQMLVISVPEGRAARGELDPNWQDKLRRLELAKYE